MQDELKGIKKEIAQVSFAAQEAINARTERRERRFFAVIILLICLLVATNGAWLAYEMSMETVDETSVVTFDGIEQTSESGSNNVVGGDFVNGYAED